MARKNLLAGLMDDGKKFTAVNQDEAGAGEKTEKQPLTYKGIGALGAVTRSIDALAAKADAARAIENKLAQGETIVDIDTDLIDDSFVSDRMIQDDSEFADLVTAMRERGQDSPVLVRPHPEQPGRYQIAFGHRRVRAARVLERPVRALVKRLDDRDHVIAQGQENSARADLSFIERTMFAHRLNERGFDRETIMSALSADKTTVSKMLSVTKRIPADILVTIEGARGVGRDRWHDLSTRLDDDEIEGRLRKRITDPGYQSADPDQRFELLEKWARTKAGTTAEAKTGVVKPETWQRRDGAVKARIKNDGKQFTIALKAREGAAFGQYLARNLDRFYEAFEAETQQKDGG